MTIVALETAASKIFLNEQSNHLLRIITHQFWHLHTDLLTCILPSIMSLGCFYLSPLIVWPKYCIFVALMVFRKSFCIHGIRNLRLYIYLSRASILFSVCGFIWPLFILWQLEFWALTKVWSCKKCFHVYDFFLHSLSLMVILFFRWPLIKAPSYFMEVTCSIVGCLTCTCWEEYYFRYV